MSDATCAHLGAITTVRHAKRRECAECVKMGAPWVHLRTCQACGATLCCDSSPNRHASKHAGSSGHPVVALNRAIAVAQREGPERGLEEIGAIADRDRLAAYPFYYAALGELELRRGRGATAREHFRRALALARNSMERRFLEQRIAACAGGAPQQALQEE